MWRKKKSGSVVCNGCYLKNNSDDSQNNSGHAAGGSGNNNGNGKSSGNGSGGGKSQAGRKTGRTAKRIRYRQIVNAAKSQSTKGKNRRIIFKKNVSDKENKIKIPRQFRTSYSKVQAKWQTDDYDKYHI